MYKMQGLRQGEKNRSADRLLSFLFSEHVRKKYIYIYVLPCTIDA